MKKNHANEAKYWDRRGIWKDDLSKTEPSLSDELRAAIRSGKRQRPMKNFSIKAVFHSGEFENFQKQGNIVIMLKPGHRKRNFHAGSIWMLATRSRAGNSWATRRGLAVG